MSPIYMFLIAGLIIVVAIFVVKWYINKKDIYIIKNEERIEIKNEENYESNSKEITEITKKDSQVPLMVFAVNDNGNFDLTDMAGKMLDSSFGNNSKIYINLLDQAEKDTQKVDETGQIMSKVGNTKLYQIGQTSYIVNFTRL